MGLSFGCPSSPRRNCKTEEHFPTVSCTSPQTQYIDNPVPGMKNLIRVVL